MTRHAAERWARRCRPSPCPHLAVRGAWLRSVVVPARARRALRLDGQRYREVRVSAAAVLVCSHDAVVTVTACSLDVLADALAWLLVGVWP